MRGLRPSSDVLNYEESALLLGSSSISGSSPLPLLPPKRRTMTTRRHVIIRVICSPFTAVFGTTCARASASDDNADHDGGVARRPSLEELLKMEASSNPELIKAEPHMARYDSWKESAIVVFDITDDEKSRTDEKDDARLAISKDQHAFPSNEEQQTAVMPVEFDVGQPAGLGSGAILSLTVLMNLRRLVLVLAALRARSMALKGSYRRMIGRRAADKTELFYQRPIPLGRRCRVQHLEESPYL